MLRESEICILIPTYNRVEDLSKLVKSIINQKSHPGKIIVLDQSKNKDTQKIIRVLKKKNKFLEYRHYNLPSKNNALNDSIKSVKKNFKAIFFIDDDVEVLPGFIDYVLSEFNEHNEVMGVGSVDINDHNKFNPEEFKTVKFKILNLLLGFMLLPHKDNHKFKILGPYGNTASPRIEKDIRNCEWIPGFVMCYRTEVFDNYKIPERIGYDVSEDIDLGYHTYTKYGKGSLVIPEKIKVYHNYSQIERYPDKKRIFVNHEDHFNFYYRYFNNPKGTIKFIWEIFWINILNILRVIIKPKKENFLKVNYLWQALSYCIKNRKMIKSGKSRMFLNPDLSMKEEYK